MYRLNQRRLAVAAATALLLAASGADALASGQYSTGASQPSRDAQAAPLPPLVDAAALGKLLGDPRLLVVRVVPQRPDATDAGLPYVSLADDLTGPRAGPGLYPPPQPAQLQALAERLGVTGESRLVLVSQGHPRDAARAWLVLRWAGIRHVSVLDGGIKAWRPLAGSYLSPSRSAGAALAGLPGGAFPVVDAAGAAEFARGGTLIDARIAGTYSQDGHIPGARNLPAPLVIDGDERLLAPERIRALLAQSGVAADRPVAVYGNGGVGAALLVLALEAAGVPVSFYWGSWPDWRSDPSRPVVHGDGAF